MGINGIYIYITVIYNNVLWCVKKCKIENRKRVSECLCDETTQNVTFLETQVGV